MQDRMTSLCSGMAYTAMVAEVRRALGAGGLKIGDRLAGEVNLAKQYGISVTSVRSGIEVLVKEGLVERRRGSGTYICGEIPQVHTPPSRRDTVALVWHAAIRTYHPFYSELFSSLRATLGRLGWAVWEPVLQAPDTREDIFATQLTPDHIGTIVADHPMLAGLITNGWWCRPRLPRQIPGFLLSRRITIPICHRSPTAGMMSWSVAFVNCSSADGGTSGL